MTLRAVVNSILVVTIASVVLALGLWWLTSAAPSLLAEHTVTAPAAVQRLAEMLAQAAVPAVTTGDPVALAGILAPSSHWPEIVYVSIENVQGRILAHTDAAKTGRAWSSRLAAEVRATVKVPYEEVGAPIVHQAAGAKSGARVGHVRLGYVVDAVTSVVPEPSTSPLPLWLALGLAMLVGLPAGLIVARVTSVSAPEAAPPPTAETEASATSDEVFLEKLRALRAETERLRSKLDERGRRLDERSRQLDQHELDLAEARAAVENRTTEAEELRRAIATHLAELERLRQENEDWQAVVRRLKAELAGSTAGAHGPEQLSQGRQTDEQLLRLRREVDGHGLPELARYQIRQLHGRAIGYISHVLRGSLTNVLGFSKLLLRQTDGPLNEAQVASVTNIQDAGLRLLTFVTVLSEYARVETGTVECHPEPVDFAPLLREVVSDLERSGSSIPVKLDAIPEAVAARTDRSHVRRILSALIQQPQSPPGHGEVVLAVRTGTDVVEVGVAHPRRVIPPGEVSTLFDPFPPEAVAPSHPDGHRVHLALARALATMNGGELRVESREETGVLFTLTIPAACHRSSNTLDAG